MSNLRKWREKEVKSLIYEELLEDYLNSEDKNIFIGYNYDTHLEYNKNVRIHIKYANGPMELFSVKRERFPIMKGERIYLDDIEGGWFMKEVAEE